MQALKRSGLKIKLLLLKVYMYINAVHKMVTNRTCTMLNFITINDCIKIVNINTKTNNYKCIIVTDIAYRILNLITIVVCRYGLHNVHRVVFELRQIPQFCWCSSGEVSLR